MSAKLFYKQALTTNKTTGSLWYMKKKQKQEIQKESRRAMVTLPVEKWKEFDAWRNQYGYDKSRAIEECIRLRLVT